MGQLTWCQADTNMQRADQDHCHRQHYLPLPARNAGYGPAHTHTGTDGSETDARRRELESCGVHRAVCVGITPLLAAEQNMTDHTTLRMCFGIAAGGADESGYNQGLGG